MGVTCEQLCLTHWLYPRGHVVVHVRPYPPPLACTYLLTLVPVVLCLRSQLPLGLGYIELHGLPCPATPGPTEFSLEVTLPAIAPPGDYDISLAGTDDFDGGAPALCLDVKVEL